MRRQQKPPTREVTSAALAYLLKRRLWLAADIAAVTAIGGGLWWQWLNIVPTVAIPAPPPLPNPNAFDTFSQAGKLIVDKDAIDGITAKADQLPSKRNGVPYSDAEKAAAIAANADALKTLRSGFSQTFQHPARRSFDAMFPELAKFRALARLLNAEGQVRETNGDLGGAAQSRLDAIHLGTEVPRGGNLIASLVGMACENIGRGPLWSLADKLSGTEARAAAKRLEEMNAQRMPWAEALVEEKWSTEAGLLKEFQTKSTLRFCREATQMVSGDSNDADTGWYEDLSRMAPMMIPLVKTSKTRIAQDHAAYMDSVIARARLPYAAASTYSMPPMPNDPINAILFPVFEGAHIRDADVRMQNSLLITVLALRAYQAEQGAYPEDLNALVTNGYLKQVPSDPFSASGNAPARYRRLVDGNYLLYSVGPDGKDDAGTAIPARKGITSRMSVEADSKGDFVVGVNTVSAEPPTRS
ncbi:MAG: hypothetical protein V4671_27740 [Armatimonadota bacterium]